MFKERFSDFVCFGDTIEHSIGDVRIVATIRHDDCPDKPDERCDGFWPSRDKEAAGYVESLAFDAALSQAKEIMRSWEADEWHYCGVVLSVWLGDYCIDDNVDSTWGIECNYPFPNDKDDPNATLTEWARKMYPGAVREAERIVASLLDKIAGYEAAKGGDDETT